MGGCGNSMHYVGCHALLGRVNKYQDHISRIWSKKQGGLSRKVENKPAEDKAAAREVEDCVLEKIRKALSLLPPSRLILD